MVLRRALVVTALLLLAPSTASAAIPEEEGGFGAEPAPPPPKPAPSCESCLRGVGAIALGLEPALVLRSGRSEGPPGFALDATLVAGGFAQSKRFMYQLVIDEGVGVGWAGLQYSGDTLVAIGIRGITSEKRVIDQGLFARTGISALYLANNVVLARIMDFPYAELGWSLVTEGFGFQVGARFGAAVVGDFSAGRRFEDRDARRQIDPAFEGGFGATLGFGERLALDGRYIEIWPDDGRSTIRYATGRMCLTIAEVGQLKLPIGTCARAMFTSTDVRELRDVPPGVDPWSRWNVGFVGLTFGLGGGGAGTLERHHRD